MGEMFRHLPFFSSNLYHSLTVSRLWLARSPHNDPTMISLSPLFPLGIQSLSLLLAHFTQAHNSLFSHLSQPSSIPRFRVSSYAIHKFHNAPVWDCLHLQGVVAERGASQSNWMVIAPAKARVVSCYGTVVAVADNLGLFPASSPFCPCARAVLDGRSSFDHG